jgi:hypothetical protein
MYKQLKEELSVSTPREIHHCVKTAKWFYIVYKSLDEKIKESKQKDFYLLNRQGDILGAKNLFIGKEYDNVVCENLLCQIEPKRFVADAQILGLDNNNVLEVGEFLSWLGTNTYPEIVIKEVNTLEKNAYLEYVKASLEFPIIIGNDCRYTSLGAFNEEYKSSVMKVAQIELFDAILESVPTRFILDWFINDEKISSIIDKGFEVTSKSSIGFIFGYKGYHGYLYGDNILEAIEC